MEENGLKKHKKENKKSGKKNKIMHTNTRNFQWLFLASIMINILLVNKKNTTQNFLV